MAKKNPHLYRKGGEAANLPGFEARYGKKHGREVYGAVVGETKRRQLAAAGKESSREYVEPHWADNPSGKGEHPVRGHYANVRVHAHSHGPGHHRGSCNDGCRRGLVGHQHSRRGRGG